LSLFDTSRTIPATAASAVNPLMTVPTMTPAFHTLGVVVGVLVEIGLPGVVVGISTQPSV
jgi:hypothetical protein